MPCACQDIPDQHHAYPDSRAIRTLRERHSTHKPPEAQYGTQRTARYCTLITVQAARARTYWVRRCHFACGVLSACRPSGRLALRHRLAGVFPRASHETRLRTQAGNLTAQQTGGLAPVPLHTNLVTQWTAWECMLSACLRDRVWPGRPHAALIVNVL